MNILRLQQFEIDMLTIKYFMLFLYQHIRCITVELNLQYIIDIYQPLIGFIAICQTILPKQMKKVLLKSEIVYILE